jgi:PAS domain S-box-containing protein
MVQAAPCVLIVDDTSSARKTLESLLKTEGYRMVFASSGAEALERAAEIRPDLILLDVMMPEMDGFEVCRRLRAAPVTFDVPIIMVTALDDRVSRLRGLEMGADDFLTKPIDWAELRARTRTILRLNRYRRLSGERRRYELLIRLSPDGIVMMDGAGKIVLANEAAEVLLTPEGTRPLRGAHLQEFILKSEGVNFFESFARLISGESTVERLETWLERDPATSQVAVGLSLGCHEWEGKQAVQCLIRDITLSKEADQERNRHFQELTNAYDVTIETLALALELRDRDMGGHGRRVAEMSVKVAQAMGLSLEEITHLRRGAFLHDIGKIAIPDTILHKPGPLSDEEWTVMHRHPGVACELLSQINFLRPAIDIPCCHHEKWDGSGYPRGLSGEDIPLAARIFSVVDVWDALSSERVYEGAWSQRDVIAYCRDHSGSHFDPRVVTVFLEVLGEDASPPAT